MALQDMAKIQYTSAQCAIIRDYRSNTRVSAVAGSGKSMTLAARVAKCLLSKDVAPANVLVLTYGDHAAHTIRDKVYDVVRERLGDVRGLSEMFIGTFHAWCLHVLRSHVPQFRKFSVLTEAQTRLLVSRYPDRSGLTSAVFCAGGRVGEAMTNAPSDIRLYLNVLSIIREEQVDLARLPPSLRKCLNLFTTLLTKKGFFDYGQITTALLHAITEAADPDCLGLQRTLAQQLHFIFVDEYQDVNHVQEAILSRLYDLSGAVMAVFGDDDQTLFGWRGSSVQNFQTFGERYQNVQERPLWENHRSSAGIVAVARAVAERISDHDPLRQVKPMISMGRQPSIRGDILAMSFATADEEAEWVANKIASIHGMVYYDSSMNDSHVEGNDGLISDSPSARARGLAWSDCAILLRSVRLDAPPLMAALERHGIPYSVAGANDLLSSPESEAAAVTFEYLAERADKNAVCSAWRTANLAIEERRLENCLTFLDSMKGRNDGGLGPCCLQTVFLGVLEALGVCEEHIPHGYDGQPRGAAVFQNLGCVSQAIQEFQAIGYRIATPQKLALFASWLRMEAVMPSARDRGNSLVRPEHVVISTIHRAKGDEWPVVFMPQLVQGRLPVFPPKNNPKWDILPKPLVTNVEKYTSSMADERRLFYTAITRSQRFLFCTWAPSAVDPRLRTVSHFFREVAAQEDVLTRDPGVTAVSEKTQPVLHHESWKPSLTFTELKYHEMCPYAYKLRFWYGFCPPVATQLGWGKSLHDCCAEVHGRMLTGETNMSADVEALVERHLHLPFASRPTIERMQAAAAKIMHSYLAMEQSSLGRIEMVEQPVEVEVDGMSVRGRIDVVKKLDSGKIVISEGKTAEEREPNPLTHSQLLLGCLGYRALTGRNPDLIEAHHLGAENYANREVVTSNDFAEAERSVRIAAASITAGQLPRLPMTCSSCEHCDHRGVCATWQRRQSRES